MKNDFVEAQDPEPSLQPKPALSLSKGRRAAPLLAINIGNSTIAIGVFKASMLVASWRAHTEVDRTVDEYTILLNDFFENAALGTDGWRGAVIGSVVPPLTATFQELCRRHLVDPLIVSSQLKTGMPIRYENPRALGVDRLVEAVAAKSKYGAPVIVIDFGTATTFNAVNRAGEFAGGAIAPGLNLAADALYHATAQLPRVDLALPPHAIATNTIHAIQSGLVYGYVAMVDGMVERMREELGESNARVIATGGRANLIAPESRVIDAVDTDLILYGLEIMYNANQ